MNSNHLVYYSVKGTKSCKARNVNEDSNKKVKTTKSFKASRGSDFVKCYHSDSVGFSDVIGSFSTETKELLKTHSKNQCKTVNSGSVNKIPLKREQVKSSPCFESVDFDYDRALIKAALPGKSQKILVKHKSTAKNTDDDIDFIPVKLVASDYNFLHKTDDKIKMSSARNNYLQTKSPDRKVNSWGRILKEQNVGKDQKKHTATVLPQSTTNKQQRTGFSGRNQTQVQKKDRNFSYEHPVQQTKNIKMKSPRESPREIPVVKKKSSHHSIRIVTPQDELDYSDSGTSITGESIMLVDRSVQCSSTHIEIGEVNNWHQNINDVNQAGDSGLAFLNPVRTLNFLVRELRGKFPEGSEDENMARIIRDMENTVTRLTNTSPQQVKDSWNTIICEEDLKCVLELLQNAPKKDNEISEAEKNTNELQHKLEEACNKLENMCKQLERATCTKIKEEKQSLLNELSDKNEELETLRNKERVQEKQIIDLKRKCEDQSKELTTLKEAHSKTVALNKILTQQLHDTEKKYKQVVTEMQFLILEKEKNIVLMKCKDQDLEDMRKSLEEIKTLVMQHLASINLEPTETSLIEDKESKLDFDNITNMSSPSTAILQKKKERLKKNDLPKCSSPAESLSPAPEEDESWRKISNVPATSPSIHHLALLSQHQQQQQEKKEKLQSKTVCVKESLKCLFDDMKKKTKLGKNLSIQNLINLDDAVGISNWSDCDISDDEVPSMAGFTLSDTDTNVSKN
ncbi:uncharacterized protein LOC142331064 [Lycorma delicatula]|uniref:uncharacterized protein LOC142331064 n=1 Tax=Lycorma delicatula TaxID=130591 RepID=UPI003F515D76